MVCVHQVVIMARLIPEEMVQQLSSLMIETLTVDSMLTEYVIPVLIGTMSVLMVNVFQLILFVRLIIALVSV